MAYIFKLPDVGEGLTEAEILHWYVKEGDKVNVDDSLVEIQNDKSAMEIPSPVSGTVVKILVPEGTAQVDEGIIEINTGEEETPSQVEVPKTADVADEAQASSVEKPTALSSGSARVRALPSVRRFARQHHVDLSKVTPTGPRGKILKEDVEAFLANPQSSEIEAKAEGKVNSKVEEAKLGSQADIEMPSPVETMSAMPAQPVTLLQEDWVENMSPTRRAIAKGMVMSRTVIPHVTVFDAVRVEKLIEHRNAYKEAFMEEGVKLTYLPYIVKAMVAMLKAHPALNATVDMDKQQIIHRGNINIGIAINTEHGLFVPVIKQADRKSIFEIAQEISGLTQKANANRLSREEMTGGSATITNIGGMPEAGGVWSTPIINYPESMIMGIARIADEVIVNKDREMEIASMMRLSFAFDHRLVDGVEAQSALIVFKKALADPNYMLLKN